MSPRNLPTVDALSSFGAAPDDNPIGHLTDVLRIVGIHEGRHSEGRSVIRRLDGVNLASLPLIALDRATAVADPRILLAACEQAVKEKCPLILFSAAGGARMQEGILSLMQMPRTTVAVQMLKEANLPFIVVLTHPTTGGVTASYAMLGDVHIAEPNALICFAGPRVIEQTIREKLPEGFQRAEYLLDHGMLDRVIERKNMREELITIVRMLMGMPPAVAGTLPPPGKMTSEVAAAGDAKA